MHPVPGHASQLAFSGVLRAAAWGPACADRPRIEWRTIVASRAHVHTHIAQGSIYTRLLLPARSGPQGTRGVCACARWTTRRPRSGLRSRAVVRGQPRPGATDTSCGMCGGVGRGVRARCITLDLMLKGLGGRVGRRRHPPRRGHPATASLFFGPWKGGPPWRAGVLLCAACLGGRGGRRCWRAIFCTGAVPGSK